MGRSRRARRRWHRDDLPRVQGRHRHGVAADRLRDDHWTVGVLVQANHGRRAVRRQRRARRARDPRTTSCPAPRRRTHRRAGVDHRDRRHRRAAAAAAVPAAGPAGSLGVARMGGVGENSSGDLFLAFATGNRGMARLDEPPAVPMCGRSPTHAMTRSSTRSSRPPRRRSSTRSWPRPSMTAAGDDPRAADRPAAGGAGEVRPTRRPASIAREHPARVVDQQPAHVRSSKPAAPSAGRRTRDDVCVARTAHRGVVAAQADVLAEQHAVEEPRRRGCAASRAAAGCRTRGCPARCRTAPMPRGGRARGGSRGRGPCRSARSPPGPGSTPSSTSRSSWAVPTGQRAAWVVIVRPVRRWARAAARKTAPRPRVITRSQPISPMMPARTPSVPSSISRTIRSATASVDSSSSSGGKYARR